MLDFSELRSRFPGAAKAALVTDSTVDRFWGDEIARDLERTGLRIERIVFPAGEKSKTLETYAELVRGLAALEFTRADFLVALGGGVVTDLAGFAAATFMRGIGWVAVPTTLLAMVDAAVGGKTGADLPEGKNLVGAFWRPETTVTDERFLETLPEREKRNGRAEMVKMHVLCGCELTVAACAAAKERIVAEDFREGGRRKFLNLGHTFGHAIEKVSDFTVPHGEAVAMGMRIVAKDAPDVLEYLDANGFTARELPDRGALLAAVRNDKKRTGEAVTLVVPRRIGECELVETPLGKLEEWL